MEVTSVNRIDKSIANTERHQMAEGYLAWKRGLDVLIALGLLLLFGPLMVLIVFGILFSSPGPVLYRQVRIGKNGKPFNMLKFRSMQVKNNPDLHRDYVQKLIRENTQPLSIGQKVLKMQGDPRITGIGKYLRKFGLDELPQFFNVLKGEMSIVGPRPSLLYEYELYEEWHKRRLSVLPGITGYWQVFAHNAVAFDDMVQMDLEYIRSMNFWLDIKIMAFTPMEMIKGKGMG